MPLLCYIISSPTEGAAVKRALQLISSDTESLHLNLFKAQEIRRLTKTSDLTRRQLAPAVLSLGSILLSQSSDEVHEVALLARINLAVKDEKKRKYDKKIDNSI